jgi:hypothetical protein
LKTEALIPGTNPTGGWVWHFRAWRRQTAWHPTLSVLEDRWLWLSPRADRLVIVGASAGWMMSHLWLSQFKSVETWDIDPWARWLFARRHGRALQAAGINWTHHHADAWAQEQAWVHDPSDTLYWFDNVLGQLRFMGPHDQAIHRIRQVRQRLRKTRWGSVHDRYSGPLAGSKPLPPAWSSEAGVDLVAQPAQEWLQAWGAEGHWLDHLTEQVFENGTPVLNLAWAYKPRFGHWLEMGWQLP